MVAVGDVAEIGRSRGPATGVGLLGPRELVVAAEPSVWLDVSRYGVDLTVVPRSRLRDIGWGGGELVIRLREEGEPQPPARPADAPSAVAEPDPAALGPPTISRSLDERLFVAMCRSFGDAIPHAEVGGKAARHRSNLPPSHR